MKAGFYRDQILLCIHDCLLASLETEGFLMERLGISPRSREAKCSQVSSQSDFAPKLVPCVDQTEARKSDSGILLANSRRRLISRRLGKLGPSAKASPTASSS